MLGLCLVSVKLVISWLPNSSDVSLAIQSLQGFGVPARTHGGTWLCSLEPFSGVEAA